MKRKIPYTQQPQGTLFANPKWAPKFAITTHNGVYDAANNARGTINGNVVQTVDKNGKALAFDGSSSYVALPSNNAYNILGPLSLVWVGTITDYSVYHSLVQRCAANGASDTPFGLIVNQTTGTLAFVRSGVGGTYSIWQTTVAVPVGVPLVIVVTNSGVTSSATSCAFTVNGVDFPYNPVVLYASAATPNNEPLFIGRRSDGNFHKGSTSLVAGFDRVFTKDERVAISGNPWQIFQTQARPIFISEEFDTLTLEPTLYSNSQSFYAPTVTQSSTALTASLFTNAQSFYAPTVTSTKTLTPSLFTNAQAFFAPVVKGTKTLTPSLFNNAQTFYAPVVSSTKTLVPTLYSNSQTFYSPTVSRGVVTLAQTLFSNAQTFYAPVVSSTKSLAPTLHSNAQVFYGPMVLASKSLVASLFTNSATHFTHTLSQAGAPQSLTHSLYSNGQTFFTPTVSRGAVTLSPSLFSNPQTYYSHVLNQAGGPQNVAPPLLTNSATFYSHTLAPGSVAIAPSLFSNSNAFYSLTLTTSKTLTPALHTNTQAFYSPIVTLVGGPLTVAPTLFSNTASFFTHTVSTGVVQLYPLRLDNESAFYPATVGNSPGFTGSISDEDIARIVSAVLAALQATAIPVNIKQVNSIPIKGAGVTGNTWGPV